VSAKSDSVSISWVLNCLAGMSYTGVGAAYDHIRSRLQTAGEFELVGGVPMLLWCPECGERHVDEGEFATKIHHTHACQACGHVWRPAVVPTCGVRFLPGFKS